MTPPLFDPMSTNTWTPIDVAAYVGSLKTQLFVAENWLQTFGGRTGKTRSLPAAVIEYLTTHAGVWNAKTIASGIGVPTPSVQTTLARLHSKKMIRKTGPGRYKSLGANGANPRVNA